MYLSLLIFQSIIIFQSISVIVGIIFFKQARPIDVCVRNII